MTIIFFDLTAMRLNVLLDNKFLLVRSYDFINTDCTFLGQATCRGLRWYFELGLNIKVSSTFFSQFHELLCIFKPARSQNVCVPDILMLDPLVPAAKAPAGCAQVLTVYVRVVLLQNGIDLVERLQGWRQA